MFLDGLYERMEEGISTGGDVKAIQEMESDYIRVKTELRCAADIIERLRAELATKDAISCDTCIREWVKCRIKGSLESIRSQNGLKIDHGSFCSEWKPREEVE